MAEGKYKKSGYYIDDEQMNLMGLSLSSVIDEKDNVFLHPQSPQTGENVLHALPPFYRQETEFFIIRMLGAEKKTGKADVKEYSSTDYVQAACMLASSAKAFSLFCSGNGGGQITFAMGMTGNHARENVEMFLRSSFGREKCEPCRIPATQKAVWTAKTTPVQFDAAQLDRREKKQEPFRWADIVASAVLGTDCSVQMDFVPADGEWVSNMLEEARKLDQEWKMYLKRQVQISANYGENASGGKNKQKLLSIMHESDNTSGGENGSLGMSLNIETHDSRFENLSKELAFRIRLLEQTLQGGWTVQITVSTRDREDPAAERVRNAVAAALLRGGFSTTWEAQAVYGKQVPAASVLLPAHLLPILISFPTRSFVGFTRVPLAELNLNPPVREKQSEDDIPIGTICWQGRDTKIPLSIPTQELNRHMAVFGMTGTGKTNTVCSLLTSLQGLPWLVIEPVKGEYHALPNSRCYNMDAGSSEALHMNPFWFPEGSSIQYHIDSLKAIISSAFDLYAAMPNILEQCLYRVYRNCGWDFISRENIYRGELAEEDLYPTFGMLCDEIERYLDESAFEGELEGNYRGALLSRLQSFTSGVKGELLNTTVHISFEEWSANNIVVELDSLADDADKAIVMGALLIQYFQYVKYKSSHKASDGLKHVFVLEEAHHLFRETPPGPEGGMSASNQLVNTLCNLLAEARAYGEGFIIVDQSPSGISPAVLKNTAVKVVHRVDYGEDIRMLKDVLLLDEESRVTASLGRGEALVRFGTMHSPALVKIPLCTEKEESVIQNGRVSQKTSRCVRDRLLSEKRLVKELRSETSRFLNFVLYESQPYRIEENFHLFEMEVRRMIIYCCGMESIESLSGNEYFIPLLDTNTVATASQNYPGQYCLVRMIRQYVLRIAELLAGSESGSISQKAWDMLLDFREGCIYPRLALFYSNDSEPAMQYLTGVLGERHDAGVLLRITDAIRKNPDNSVDDIFEHVMRQIFYNDLDEYEKEHLKELAVYYISQTAENDMMTSES